MLYSIVFLPDNCLTRHSQFYHGSRMKVNLYQYGLKYWKSKLLANNNYYIELLLSPIMTRMNQRMIKSFEINFKNMKNGRYVSLFIINMNNVLLVIKKDLRQIWNNTFIHTPIYYTKLIVGTCNNRNNIRELVSKRPSTTSTTETKTNK